MQLLLHVLGKLQGVVVAGDVVVEEGDVHLQAEVAGRQRGLVRLLEAVHDAQRALGRLRARQREAWQHHRAWRCTYDYGDSAGAPIRQGGMATAPMEMEMEIEMEMEM